MKSPLLALVFAFVVAAPSISAVQSRAAGSGEDDVEPHHKHHHRRHGKGRHQHHRAHGENTARGAAAATTSHVGTTLNAGTSSIVQAVATHAGVVASANAAQMTGNVQTLETVETCTGGLQRGRLLVNGPIPVDFNERFQHGVSQATGCTPDAVGVTATTNGEGDIIIVDFSAAANLVHSVEDQAADPYSALANGVLRQFLVADADADAAPAGLSSPVQSAQAQEAPLASSQAPGAPLVGGTSAQAAPLVVEGGAQPEGPAQPCDNTAQSMDIDTEMPYGELEPFGREDTAQELSEQAIKESDTMVDQLERAEVAEEKRSVFRALTRLRGAAIASFDGIARSQTGNIDEYNKVHTWRATHPLNHLADEESDIQKWAFPSDADF